jgi:hypothetical protein
MCKVSAIESVSKYARTQFMVQVDVEAIQTSKQQDQKQEAT